MHRYKIYIQNPPLVLNKRGSSKKHIKKNRDPTSFFLISNNVVMHNIIRFYNTKKMTRDFY